MRDALQARKNHELKPFRLRPAHRGATFVSMAPLCSMHRPMMRHGDKATRSAALQPRPLEHNLVTASAFMFCFFKLSTALLCTMGSYSTRTLRLAILECDVPIQPVLAARGTYGDIFEKVLDQSVHEHEKRQDGLEIEISKWDVVNGVKYPNMNEIDGLLITGSSRLHGDYERYNVTDT